jgi:AcrR family transcriptional regulator
MDPCDTPRRPGRPKGLDSICREKLLAEALPAFARHGFDGVSLRAIARAAGFDASMVAHHFGSKAELWYAVVEQLAQDFQTDLQDSALCIAGPRPVWQRLAAVVDHMVDRLAARPAVVMLVSREINDPSPRLDFLVEHLLRPGYLHYAPLWREGMAAGVFHQTDPAVFHMSLFGSVAMALSAHQVITRITGEPLDAARLKLEIRRTLLGDAGPD